MMLSLSKGERNEHVKIERNEIKKKKAYGETDMSCTVWETIK